MSPSGALALATNDSFGDLSGEIWVDEGNGLVSIGSFEGRVRRLAFFEGRLWVAGLFSLDASGSAVEHLAVWDGATWSAPPGGAADGPVFELTVDGPDLLVGGAFGSLGGVTAVNVATYDGSAWTPHDFDGALAVYALARDDRSTRAVRSATSWRRAASPSGKVARGASSAVASLSTKREAW